MITVRISDRGIIRTVTRSKSPAVGGYVKYQGRRCLVLATEFSIRRWVKAA